MNPAAAGTSSLSQRCVRAARALTMQDLSPHVVEKVKTAFLDMLSCAFEARDLPWSRQAIDVAGRAVGGRATVVGTPLRVSPSAAAFANGTLAHGLVREDMHAAAVSHLGVVVFPTLLALAQEKPASGREFILAAVCGYEVGAAIGRALMDQEIVRRFRPTGITGPLGAAVAGGLLLCLDEAALTNALGLVANTTGGLNEWAYAGGDEMFFHPGFAARNAVTAVELAQLGARASVTALDGQSGLFAALRRLGRVPDVTPFSRQPLEILAVYHKPAPACNYAQTGCQAALALVKDSRVSTRDIAGITVRASAAAVGYPGCDFDGPFERILQAKMSIQYCVAATLVRGAIEERNYRLLDDPEVNRLARLIRLEVDAAFTEAYPGQQGTEVMLFLRDGSTLRKRLSDVTPASPVEIRERFRSASASVLGADRTSAVEAAVDALETHANIGEVADLLCT